MTLKSFITKLNETRQTLDWMIRPNGTIRGYARGSDPETSWHWCPVTAVVYLKEKRVYSTPNAGIAADERLKLRRRTAENLILAADCSFSITTDRKYHKVFRSLLIRTLHLREVLQPRVK